MKKQSEQVTPNNLQALELWLRKSIKKTETIIGIDKERVKRRIDSVDKESIEELEMIQKKLSVLNFRLLWLKIQHHGIVYQLNDEGLTPYESDEWNYV